jgi:release factor glutamine methyltransferase
VNSPPVAAPVREALAAATDALRAAGVDTPQLDAELLLAEATGGSRAELVANPDSGVEAAAAREFGAMVRRRVSREPVAYILGRKGFRQLELAVDSRVLIPRPETELLVEVALELEPESVLDVGTGSGAIALAVADELPRVRVTATDSSPAALEVARDNAARLGLDDRVTFVAGTVPKSERLDLLVGNLPYVNEGEWGTLAPEITGYEPRDALVAGPTGLEAIEALLEELEASGTEAAAIALEVGDGQAMRVGELVHGAGWTTVDVRRDLAGIERVVIGR